MQRAVEKHISKLVKIPEVENNQLKLLTVITSLLKFYNCWPDNNKSFRSICSFTFFISFCSVIIMTSTAHLVFHILNPEVRNFSHMVYDLAIFLGGLAGYQFVPVFFTNQHRSKLLLQTLGDFSHFEKPKGIEIGDAFMNAICKIYYTSVYVLGLAVLIFKMFEECPIEEDMVCGFAFPTYMPGMMAPGLRRKLLSFVQIGSLFNSTLFGFGCLWFFLQMSNVIVAYLKQLQHILEEIGTIEGWTQRRQRTLDAVKYHHHIISMWDEFFVLSKGIFVIYVVWIPVIMGVMTYTLTVQFEIQFFAVYILWTTALCITCMFGQNMVTESEQIAHFAYMSIPTDGDLVTAKMLTMMILRSQRAMFVPAGSLTYCGYKLIVTIAQTTYSYLTLLRSSGGNN